MGNDPSPLSLSMASGWLTGTLAAAAVIVPPATMGHVMIPASGSVTCMADLRVDKVRLDVEGDLALYKDAMAEVSHLSLLSTAKVMITSTPRLRAMPMAPIMCVRGAQLLPLTRFRAQGQRHAHAGRTHTHRFCDGASLAGEHCRGGHCQVCHLGRRSRRTCLLHGVVACGGLGPVRYAARGTVDVGADSVAVELGTPVVSVGASALAATVQVYGCASSSALSREALAGIVVGAVVAGAALAALIAVALVAARRKRDSEARMWAVDDMRSPYQRM